MYPALSNGTVPSPSPVTTPRSYIVVNNYWTNGKRGMEEVIAHTAISVDVCIDADVE